MFSQSYNIIIDCGFSAPGHGREVVDVLKTTDKRFLFQLISTIKLSSYKLYDTQMGMHSATHKADASLAR